MDLINFSDPVFLIGLAGVVLVAIFMLNPARYWKARAEVETAKAMAAQGRLSRATAETDIQDLPRDTSVLVRQTLGLERGRSDIAVEGQIRAAEGLSRVHLTELEEEHQAIFRARRDADAYDREQERRRDRAEARKRRNPVSTPDGPVQETGPTSPPPARPDGKAAGRHRKSKAPDKTPGTD